MTEPLARSAIELFEAIHPSLRAEEVARTHAIFREGEPGDRLYLIIEGLVKIGCRASNGGGDRLLAIVGASDVLGEESVFDPGPLTTSAIAVTDVRVISLDGSVVRSCIAKRPEVAEQLMRTMVRRLRRINDHIFDLSLADVAGRVAKQLLVLGRRFGDVDDDGLVYLQHELTQLEIGQLTGSARETVNKVMCDFARRGWIRMDGKSVVIIDPERLTHRTRTGLGVLDAASRTGPDPSVLNRHREPSTASNRSVVSGPPPIAV